jgi:hypothetical protein
MTHAQNWKNEDQNGVFGWFFYQEYEEHHKNPKTKSKLQTRLHQIKGI